MDAITRLQKERSSTRGAQKTSPASANCSKVSEAAKEKLRQTRAGLEPIDLAEEVERQLEKILRLVERIEQERWEEMERAGEAPGGSGSAEVDYVASPVAIAPCASTPSTPAELLVKSPPNHETPGVMNPDATT